MFGNGRIQLSPCTPDNDTPYLVEVTVHWTPHYHGVEFHKAVDWQ
jgi:hypothetical protein